MNLQIVEKAAGPLGLDEFEKWHLLDILNRAEQSAAELDKIFARGEGNGAVNDVRLNNFAFIAGDLSAGEPELDDSTFTGAFAKYPGITKNGLTAVIATMKNGQLAVGFDTDGNWFSQFGAIVANELGFSVQDPSGSPVYVRLEEDLSRFGANISAPNTTALSIFHVAQTHNSESMAAGAALFGSNSASKANMLWNPSNNRLEFRGGTTVQAYVNTTGEIGFGGGAGSLSVTGFLVNAPGVYLEFNNTTSGVGEIGAIQTIPNIGRSDISFVSAQQLTVPDNGFESGGSDWIYTGSAAQSSVQAKEGTYSGFLTALNDTITSANYIAVSNLGALLDFWVYRTGTPSNLKCEILCYGAGPGYSALGTANFLTTIFTTGAVWTRFMLVGAYPDGTENIKIRFTNLNASRNIWIDEIKVYDGYGFQYGAYNSAGGFLLEGGATLPSNTYPSATFLQWLAMDTGVLTGSLISDYGGAAVNTGLRVIGQAHDSGVSGYAALWGNDHNGVTKGSLYVSSEGQAEFEFTAATGAGTQGLTVIVETSEDNAINNVLSLATRSTNTVGNGLGTALSFFIENSAGVDKQAGYLSMAWNDKTSGSEDTSFAITLLTAGSPLTVLTSSGAGGTILATPLSVTGGEANNQVGGAVASALKVINTNIGAVGRIAELQFGIGTASLYAAISGAVTDGTNKTRGNIVFSTRNLVTDANLTERMTILGGGQVGVNTVTPTSILTVNGPIATSSPVTEINATRTVLVTDSSIICNRAGTVTLTLPTASSFSGRWLYVKTVTANTVVSASSNVVPRAGGAAGTAILAATAGRWAALQSDGTNWVIMMSN